MCKYQPDLVHSYLRNSENYRLEETLAVTLSCLHYSLQTCTYLFGYALETVLDYHPRFQAFLA